MRVARVVALASAVLICAWFALGARQAHETAAATSLLSGNGSLNAQQIAHARSLVDGASLLNPDIEPKLLSSKLAIKRHEFARAVEIARAATREEPQNVATWLAVAVAAFDSGRPDGAAVGAMVKLDPLLSHGH
jgi:Flp pilus assembly protein TadD